jgi:uncharacterized protein (TIGR03084 family)
VTDLLDTLLADLAAESAAVDDRVSNLGADGWATPTPAAGWTVAHQIAHLAWTDQAAYLAATSREGFADELAKASADPAHYVDKAAEEGARLPPDELLAAWRAGRAALAKALRDLPPGTKTPWYGPPMSPASVVTGRLMETWAHGQDIADALGVSAEPAARLRHIAHLGVRTRTHGYLAHGLEAPDDEVRVELTAPDGTVWTWGPLGAASRVTGPALDFCLLVTQRRNRADLALRATGSASTWLDVAQTFAGPPGSGRPLAGTAG